MTVFQFRKIADPGHGWLELPIQVYVDIAKQHGIRASACSYYSPERRMVYLEEDCDLYLFLSKMPSARMTYEYEETTFIRDLPSIAVLNKELDL